MNWGLFGQLLVGAIFLLISIGATATAYQEWRASYDRRQRERAARAERVRSEKERSVERQRRLLAIADVIADAPIHEQQRLQREAEALGFLDDEGTPPWAA